MINVVFCGLFFVLSFVYVIHILAIVLKNHAIKRICYGYGTLFMDSV